MRFKTKPFEIDAVQWDGTFESAIRIQQTLGANNVGASLVKFENCPDDDTVLLWVYDHLHDSWINVYEGQWVIKGSKQELYPCDPEVFETKYEAIDE